MPRQSCVSLMHGRAQVLDRWALHSALQRVQAAAAARGLPLRVPASARVRGGSAGLCFLCSASAVET